MKDATLGNQKSSSTTKLPASMTRSKVGRAPTARTNLPTSRVSRPTVAKEQVLEALSKKGFTENTEIVTDKGTIINASDVNGNNLSIFTPQNPSYTLENLKVNSHASPLINSIPENYARTLTQDSEILVRSQDHTAILHTDENEIKSIHLEEKTRSLQPTSMATLNETYYPKTASLTTRGTQMGSAQTTPLFEATDLLQDPETVIQKTLIFDRTVSENSGLDMQEYYNILAQDMGKNICALMQLREMSIQLFDRLQKYRNIFGNSDAGNKSTLQVELNAVTTELISQSHPIENSLRSLTVNINNQIASVGEMVDVVNTLYIKTMGQPDPNSINREQYSRINPDQSVNYTVDLGDNKYVVPISMGVEEEIKGIAINSTIKTLSFLESMPSVQSYGTTPQNSVSGISSISSATSQSKYSMTSATSQSKYSMTSGDRDILKDL